MNAPRLTDDQIARALRAHLPDRAQGGLRERILETTETTAQQRALPSFLGGLSDADPVVRRRSVLLAAALLAAVAVATAAAVGAWRLLHRDPLPPQLVLQPPTDVPAYVSSTVDRLPQVPPVAFTVLASDGTGDRIYVDRSGAVRYERYASPDASQPTTLLLMSGTRVGRTVIVADKPVWIQQDGAIGEDPRGYLRAVTDLWSPGASGCDLKPDPSDAATATPAAAWRYVDSEIVAGRPAQHLACGGEDVWIDDATRLILRNRVQATDDAGNAVPGVFQTTEVTKIEFGDQPASLFAFAPPPGVAAMSDATYGALCPGDTVALLDYPPCAGTGPSAAAAATPEPTPSPTPPANPSECAAPPDESTSTGPLTWTKGSLKEDWPAPVRQEPAGGASVTPMPPTYIDPSGDTGSSATSCVDIRDLTAAPRGLSFSLMAKPPNVDPSRVWIAYGVVVDEDGDGVPDWRYGIDNVPGTARATEDHHRAWRTNLHTGHTEFNLDASPLHEMDKVGATYFGSGYPALGSGPEFRFFEHGDVAGGGEFKLGAKQDKPFYVWASMIVDGRVAATDYAPDSGWLLPTTGEPAGGTSVTNVEGLRISMVVPSGGRGLDFLIIDRGLQLGCDHPNGTSSEMRVGPSVDDLVTFLDGLQAKVPVKTNVALKISETTDVTVDGYRGKYLEFATTGREDNCGPPDGPSAPDWPLGGSNHEAWILDVDGVRLVIDAQSQDPPSDADKAANQQIVDSIQIGP